MGGRRREPKSTKNQVVVAVVVQENLAGHDVRERPS